ncbi:S8 family serine peptidase [Phytohabitans flavus]|uniref:S8 family serine peptidase n=1 Tax=Phytohabitans flavus TaxID=1076124 RepID=UPI0039EA4465
MSATLSPDQIRDDQWHLRFLNVQEAHKHSVGDDIVVAVIDTGVDQHPDLARNLLRGTDTLSGSGDGRIDTDSHGTGMAGLIAAHGTTSGMGALGIAPEAAILPIRSEGPAGQADSDLLAAGIEWAIERGAAVINASSTGGPSPHCDMLSTQPTLPMSSLLRRPGTGLLISVSASLRRMTGCWL